MSNGVHKTTIFCQSFCQTTVCVISYKETLCFVCLKSVGLKSVSFSYCGLYPLTGHHPWLRFQAGWANTKTWHENTADHSADDEFICSVMKSIAPLCVCVVSVWLSERKSGSRQCNVSTAEEKFSGECTVSVSRGCSSSRPKLSSRVLFPQLLEKWKGSSPAMTIN